MAGASRDRKERARLGPCRMAPFMRSHTPSPLAREAIERIWIDAADDLHGLASSGSSMSSLVHQLPDLLALALLLRHQLVVALLGHVLAYGALNETAQPPWINGVPLHAHAAAKAAGAAVAALGRPRGQAPLLDLCFGDGKPCRRPPKAISFLTI